MKVVILSFDGLEHSLVELFNCRNVMQREYGKVNLEKYLDNRPKGRGSGDPLTPEVYLTLITAVIPKESYNEMSSQVDKKYPSIFQFSDKSFDLEIPAYSKVLSWVARLTGSPVFNAYWKNKISLERAERAQYKHMELKVEYADLINELYDYDFIFIYFKETDHFQHMYTNWKEYKDKFESLYRKVDKYVKQLVNVFEDGNTLIIIISDHGSNLKGGHSHHGFWSSNKPLGRGDSIELTEWYGLFKEWYEKEKPLLKKEEEEEKEVFTDEEKERVIKHLKQLGYLE